MCMEPVIVVGLGLSCLVLVGLMVYFYYNRDKEFRPINYNGILASVGK